MSFSKKESIILVFRLALLACFTLFVYFIFQLFSFSYDEFVEWAINIISRPDLEQKVRATISEASFSQIRVAALLSIVLAGILVILTYYKAEKILTTLQTFFGRIKQSIRSFYLDLKAQPKAHVIAFLIISIVYLVKSYWYVFYWPMQYDEAWTFNHFINKPWLVSFTAPHNNHIFYTQIAKLSYHLLSFLRPIEAIRFPLPIFGLFSGVVLYRYVQKQFGHLEALLSFAFFLSTGFIIFYSLYARAYMIGIFFNLLFLYSYTQFFKTRERYYYALFILAAILAIYSIPTSIYFLAPISLCLFLIKLRDYSYFIKPLFLAFIIAFVVTLLLYSPVIISTKMSWLLSGVKGNELLLINAKKHSTQMSLYLSGLRPFRVFIYPLLLLLSVIGFFVSKKGKEVFLLSFVSLISPIIFIALQHKFVFSRVFSYNAIFYAILLGFWIAFLIKKLKLRRFYPYIATISFIFFSYKSHFQGFFNWSNDWDNTVKEMFFEIKEQKIEETYNYFYYSKPALEYYSFEYDYDFDIFMPQKSSISYQDFATKEWESIIWWNGYKGEEPNLEKYDQVWQRGNFSLYHLRKSAEDF